MNVFIARDGATVGEYPREEAEEIARTGADGDDDAHYWQEGMSHWLPLADLLKPDAPAAKIVALNRFGQSQNGTFHGPAVNGANVFIARDGEVIGEYPRKQLGEMARAHELQRDDTFWRDGMKDWLPLPEILAPEDWEPPPPPLPPLDYAALFGTGVAMALLLGIIGFFWIKPDRGIEAASKLTAQPFEDAATGIQLRDKAAADLRLRIERLSARAEPPLNTFYYDFRINMSRIYSARASWRATIHGFESIVDSNGQQTASRTELTLIADYEGTDWVYKHYDATVTDFAEQTTTEIAHEGDNQTPPSIVGILGLRTINAPFAPISLKIAEK